MTWSDERARRCIFDLWYAQCMKAKPPFPRKVSSLWIGYLIRPEQIRPAIAMTSKGSSKRELHTWDLICYLRTSPAARHLLFLRSGDQLWSNTGSPATCRRSILRSNPLSVNATWHTCILTKGSSYRGTLAAHLFEVIEEAGGMALMEAVLSHVPGPKYIIQETK